MHRLLRALFGSRDSSQANIQQINKLRAELSSLSDSDLRLFAQTNTGRIETMAAVAVAASRILGMEMFDVQLQGALGLTEGKIIEMQTGEGKTLAAVPAVVCYAKIAKSVHVMTVNDYLARRDAQWMGDIYKFFGLSVGYIQREMTERSSPRWWIASSRCWLAPQAWKNPSGSANGLRPTESHTRC